jgi:hypothetical protein
MALLELVRDGLVDVEGSGEELELSLAEPADEKQESDSV